MAASLGRCGRYALLRFLDAGGMGEVFLARGPLPGSDDAIVAVKRLLPQVARDRTAVGMFMDEAHIASRLVHPNIARVYRADRGADTYFLVMEWVDGQSLRAIVRRTASAGPMPWNVAVRIIADAASGLDYAHRLADEGGNSYGIIHRDVSSPNIMVGYDGRTRLLDFGLAKARTQLERTKPGLLKGKFAYLAPEQLRGELSTRSDVFGLGLCLWEAVAGRSLFGAGSAAETMVEIQQHRAPPKLHEMRSDVPPELDEILAHALAPDPEARIQTAAEVRDALESLLVSKRTKTAEADVAAWLSSKHPRDQPIVLPDSVPPPAGPTTADLVDAEPASGSSAGRLAVGIAVVVTVAAIGAAFALGLL